MTKAVEEYRAAWRAKMDEVNACIAANADQEELVDQPEVDRKVTRVSGPFTVEALQPPEMSLGNGVTLVLEIKGFEDDQTKAKHTAARRWVEAVNNWGQLGSWAFHVCRNPQLLGKEMAYLAAALPAL